MGTDHVEIKADAAYPLKTLAARLGWGKHSIAAAKRAGLKTVTAHRVPFVLGSDFLNYLREIAERN